MSIAIQTPVSIPGSVYAFLFQFSVVYSVTSYYADDFLQLFQIYSNVDGIIAANDPGTLFRYDDFDIDERTLDDFYFSVPFLVNYY